VTTFDSVDLRSDTVTRPTREMLEAMMQARVGDDVLGEDETVNALQSKAANMFGMDAALFCPTGTMSNQIGIKVHTQPADEVICSDLAHIYLFEAGGIAFHSASSVRLLSGGHGRFTADQVRSNINSRDDAHLPWTRLVAIENTVNKGGGACWDVKEIADIRAVCDEHVLALHLDGARLFNALVARAESSHIYGGLFHTISICLSKGLGAPAGSLLLGPKDLIRKAHRLRKLMGGGMRQAGYLAAAGIYALDHNVHRLKEDHDRAKVIEAELRGMGYVTEVLPAETNIVIARLEADISVEAFLCHLRKHGVRASSMGGHLVRFVLHLDVRDRDMEVVRRALRWPLPCADSNRVQAR
jgi:threonine aldolase